MTFPESLTANGSTPILVVDDEEPFRRLLGHILRRAGYLKVSLASSSAEALQLLLANDFAVMLTDMSMPGGSGLELLRRTREQYPNLATVMVTATDEAKLADEALSMGAYGYVIKPFKDNEVLNSVNSAIRRRQLESVSQESHAMLQEQVRARTSELWSAIQTLEQREQDLNVSHEDTIERLSIAAELRDDEAITHIKRMSRYCALLAGWAGLDTQRCEMVRRASMMHDVGKIGIPDAILLKPGTLTPNEYVLMQQHAEFGARILSGSHSELLEVAATIAWTHHEKCDGSGYPRGLPGDEIPLEGRIAAIADVFDALTTDRVYRKAFGFTDAVGMMKDGRGSHFDPDLLDLFLANLDQVVKAKELNADEDGSTSHLSVVTTYRPGA